MQHLQSTCEPSLSSAAGRSVKALVPLLLIVLLLSTAVSAIARARETSRRELGFGQVRFNGVGPERWAQRYRIEHRVVLVLRARLAGKLEGFVQLVRAFECVHQGEGSWGANTGNGYYGGLQMDLSFQRAYAPRLLQSKGTADHWTPAEQMAAAIVAHATRGFAPWPLTARRCGLY